MTIIYSLKRPQDVKFEYWTKIYNEVKKFRKLRINAPELHIFIRIQIKKY